MPRGSNHNRVDGHTSGLRHPPSRRAHGEPTRRTRRSGPPRRPGPPANRRGTQPAGRPARSSEPRAGGRDLVGVDREDGEPRVQSLRRLHDVAGPDQERLALDALVYVIDPMMSETMTGSAALHHAGTTTHGATRRQSEPPTKRLRSRRKGETGPRRPRDGTSLAAPGSRRSMPDRISLDGGEGSHAT